MKNEISLVIDGSGSTVFVGLLDSRNRWLALEDRAGAPLEELFPAVEAVLQRAAITLDDVDSYLYCEGPGSVLGLRLCAMAIKTWTRLYPKSARLFKYNSMELTAYALLHARPDLTDALIVSDWKKGAWNGIVIKDGSVGPAQVIDDPTLANWSGPLYHLPQRKGWQSPPAKAHTLQYAPAQLDTVRTQPMFLQATDEIVLYSSGINTFQKWTPARHRAQA